MKFLNILKLVVPQILALNPKTAAIAPLIVHGISEAEQIQGASGAEKKAHALNLVSVGIAGMNAAAGKVVVDPADVTQTVSDGIDTAVGVVNLASKHAA